MSILMLIFPSFQPYEPSLDWEAAAQVVLEAIETRDIDAIQALMCKNIKDNIPDLHDKIALLIICGNYSRSGKLACTTHRITMEDITQLVLEDIRRNVGRAVCDEKALQQELKLLKGNDAAAKLKVDKSQQKALYARLNELERLTQSLYEDKVRGTIPEAVCQNLIQKYEAERVEKAAQIEEILQRLAQAQQDDNDVEHFLEAVKRYVAIETLDREMLLELIDFIEVGQLTAQEDGLKSRDVAIHYKFVGKIA